MAEKIIQGSIIRNGCFWTATCPEGVFDVRALNEKDAAQKLVDLHWREVCKIVFRAQNFKCSYCLRLRPLQGHHKTFRSRGRVDSVTGTEGLCSDCHDGKYGPHGRTA